MVAVGGRGRSGGAGGGCTAAKRVASTYARVQAPQRCSTQGQLAGKQAGAPAAVGVRVHRQLPGVDLVQQRRKNGPGRAQLVPAAGREVASGGALRAAMELSRCRHAAAEGEPCSPRLSRQLACAQSAAGRRGWHPESGEGTHPGSSPLHGRRCVPAQAARLWVRGLLLLLLPPAAACRPAPPRHPISHLGCASMCCAAQASSCPGGCCAVLCRQVLCCASKRTRVALGVVEVKLADGNLARLQAYNKQAHGWEAHGWEAHGWERSGLVCRGCKGSRE